MTTKTERQFARNIRIGLVVTSSLVILMIAVFFIGSEQKIFAKKYEYEIRLESVSGLAEGNPVKLAGVTVGAVKDIELPADPTQQNVLITLVVDRKFAGRIRLDSRARLKKLGLLAGDSYIDITPGSPNLPPIEPGSIIPAQRPTNVEALISSGEDLVDNFVQISYSLKNVLARVDRGEGLLGELTSSPEKRQRITDSLVVTLNRTNDLLDHVQSGKGVLGKLVYDDAYADQLTADLSSSAHSLETIMASMANGFEKGSGPLPALLTDPEGGEKVLQLVENMRLASERLAIFSESLRTGEGLLSRLISDKEFADETLGEFRDLVRQLDETAQKLNNGQGTAGKLIADPAIYESINDILIGINESKMLRWLIRTRQDKGIERRYRTEKTLEESAPPPPRSTPPLEKAPPEVITPLPPASEPEPAAKPAEVESPDAEASQRQASEAPVEAPAPENPPASAEAPAPESPPTQTPQSADTPAPAETSPAQPAEPPAEPAPPPGRV